MSVKKFTRVDVINDVAARTALSRRITTEVLNALDDVLYSHMSEANLNEDIDITVFDGFKLSASYVPPKPKHDNLTDKDIITAPAARVKLRTSYTYRRRLAETMLERMEFEEKRKRRAKQFMD